MSFLVSIMEFFVSSAHADAGAPAAQGGGNMFMIIALVLFIGVFYFLTIRPQQKKEKEHTSMLDALAEGDEVLTSGGLLGKVTKVGDNFVAVEVSKDVEINIQRRSVMTLMPKGSIDSI